MSTFKELEWKLDFLKHQRLPFANSENRNAIEKEIESVEAQLNDFYKNSEVIHLDSESTILLVDSELKKEDPDTVDYYRDRFNRFGTIAATVVYFVNAWNPTAPIL
jgi:hypothetical protein